MDELGVFIIDGDKALINAIEEFFSEAI